MLAGRGEGYFSDIDSDAIRSSSWSDTDKDINKDDAEYFDIDISNDDSDKGDNDVDGFGVFMYDKIKELPKFTPISLIVTCSSIRDYTNLLNDQSDKELMDLMRGPV
nr:hypothetical protein [Tanacetum cinerariifolium]